MARQPGELSARAGRRAWLAGALLPVALLGPGCITYHSIDDGVARARLGEAVRSGPVTIAPDRLIEDSRCAAGMRCVQAGTVRISARIDGAMAELALDRPEPVRGGMVVLVEAYPPARARVQRYPDEYRFGFRWIASPGVSPR